MPRRDWLSNISIAGWVIAGVMLAIAFGQWVTIAHQSSDPSTSQQSHQARSKQSENVAGPLATNQGEYRKAYDPGCPYPKDRDDADLCEQRRMANAAEESVAIAVSQWRWNVAQSTATIFAALATGWAAWAAARAARSAHEGVALAGLTAERQLRAYLSFVSILVTGVAAGKKPKVEIVTANLGATPAHDLVIVHFVFLGPHPQAIGMKAGQTVGSADVHGSIEPQIRIKRRPDVGFILTAEDVDAIAAGTKAIYIIGIATYRDVFKKQCRYVRFHMFNERNVARNESEAIFCPYGNSYEYDVGEEPKSQN